MDFSEFNQLILSLLEKDYFKNIDYLVQELRVEYPDQYHQVMKQFQEEYHLSTCGMMMSPITAVNISLDSLLKESLVEKKTEKGQSLWRLKMD
ncbi:hypothetical protein [Dehalobacterium formicoaceticum]|uniref:hypothetical protein n=1 Tax=Dehalobacterium formicoaceticum TaxID=51515 RepID=UPI000B7F2F4D|nr:hypothetical protein [Dehalobacterium formicoaceticum]